jgi:type IV pilus assembly protein PilA
MKLKKGFTLLEVLLVVAIIAILAGIVILAINPNKQLADTRNTQRRSDVATIINAIYQYSIDNNGTLPGSLATATSSEICKIGGSCAGFTDLSILASSSKYLVSIPVDPTGQSTNGTGYYAVKTVDNRVTVSAPSAEGGVTIEISK